MMSPSRRPPSATHFGLNVGALGAGLGALVCLYRYGPAQMDALVRLIICSGVVATVIAVGEAALRGTLLADGCGLQVVALRPFRLAHALTRLFGFAATLTGVAALYWLAPEYHGSFYAPYWQFLQLLAPVALPLSVLYFLWSDPRIDCADDAYWHLGRLILGQRPDKDVAKRLREHAAAWLVKAFFLALMVVYARDEFNAIGEAFGAAMQGRIPWNSYQLGFRLGYTTDLLFCIVGYVLTLRVFDSHIRSTDPSVDGWLVALICYQPFYSVIGNLYLHYEESRNWSEYLSAYPAVAAIWAFFIVVLVLIYASCTVAFGLRFSNLTYRGIITGGPYRYLKHPAYLSKNMSWWLISMPFISAGGWSTALRHCLLLGLLNTVYYLRALTEERHLRQDPIYVAYEAWIAEHGLFAYCRRRFSAALGRR